MPVCCICQAVYLSGNLADYYIISVEQLPYKQAVILPAQGIIQLYSSF
jgi:hypothetical protein